MGLVFSNIPELEGSDTEIALSNLAHLEFELGETLEKRIAHLCELARAIISDGEDIDVIKSIILSIRSDGEVEDDEVSPDNLSELRSMFSGLSVIERMIIFKQIFELMPSERYSPLQSEDEIPRDCIGKIAYVKNSFNDVAFDALSRLLLDAKASYFDSAAEVCASVLDGKCQFCIFPIETSGDGKLKAFYDLILKYNFKINAQFDLHNSRSEGYTRYALLSCDAVARDQAAGARASRHLQIAYSDTDSIPLGELITSAEFCGLTLENVESVMLDSTKKRMFFAEFRAADADVSTFMTYLSVDCPEHLLIGLYQRI